MFRRFQHRLAISPTSLHTVSAIVIAAWVITRKGNPIGIDATMGLWSLLPDTVIQPGIVNTSLGILSAVSAIYLLGELNISQILLRLNSRVISFVFASLITAALFLHSFNPGMIVMLCILMSYFTLFSSYQLDNPTVHAYVSFLYLSISTLFFPSLIWLSPVYWLSLYMLRAVSGRSICASVLGLLTPYWLVGSAAFLLDHSHVFTRLLHEMVAFHWNEYNAHTLSETLFTWFTFLIFLIGFLDFYMRINLDKTRTRTLYSVISIHGFFFYLMILIQPSHMHALLPVALLPTSIMGGHYVANDDTPVSNATVCILTIVILFVFILNAWIL